MRSDVYVNRVLKKCERFQESVFWPPEPKIRARAWMENFADAQDKAIAARLLDNFIFYKDSLVDHMLDAAFNAIPSARNNLASLQDAVLTRVEGEDPNPTDSGILMGRKARQVLGVPQESIVDPSVAIDHALNGGTVVFCDDFIGSGNQFSESWHRSRPTKRGKTMSFSEVHRDRSFKCFYLCLLTTEYGLRNLASKVPEVKVCTCHIVGPKNSVHALGENNVEQNMINNFLRRVAPRLTFVDGYMSHIETKAFGFHRLGLTIGFDHSIPDATIPIFWAPGNDWTPLVKRV